MISQENFTYRKKEMDDFLHKVRLLYRLRRHRGSKQPISAEGKQLLRRADFITKTVNKKNMLGWSNRLFIAWLTGEELEELQKISNSNRNETMREIQYCIQLVQNSLIDDDWYKI